MMPAASKHVGQFSLEDVRLQAVRDLWASVEAFGVKIGQADLLASAAILSPFPPPRKHRLLLRTGLPIAELLDLLQRINADLSARRARCSWEVRSANPFGPSPDGGPQ